MADPYRPPRKNTETKEKRKEAGFLVQVVRTLTTSASNEQREVEKERLRIGFKETEKNVDHLITVHQDDLINCLQSFTQISDRISGAKERIRSVKHNITTCKTLLAYKKDELQKLFSSSAEQRHIHTLYEKIEKVKEVPHTVKDYLANKHFLHGSEVLVLALAELDGDLMHVEALNLLREELTAKKEEVFQLILDEIDRILYLTPQEALNSELRRGGSIKLKESVNVSGNNELANAGRNGSGFSVQSITKSSNSLLKFDGDSPKLDSSNTAEEDLTNTSPQANPLQYLAVLAESLGVIDRLGEAVDIVKPKMTTGLMKIIQHTTNYLIDKISLQEVRGSLLSGTVGEDRHLAELLQLLFRQFKMVAGLHQLLITQLNRVAKSRGINENLYDINEVWNQIQSVVILLLSDYFDVKNASVSLPTVLDSTASLSSYFSRKRPPKSQRKPNLFRFEGTTHAININAYAKEKKLNAPLSFVSSFNGESTENQRVCNPSAQTVIVAFKPMMRFIGEIESKLSLVGRNDGDENGSKCQLRRFFEDFVLESYLPQLRASVVQQLDVVLSANDAWRKTISTEDMRRLDVSVPLLQSTVKVVTICRQLCTVMGSLPTFSDKISSVQLLLFEKFLAEAEIAYDNLTRAIKMQNGGTNATDQQVEYRKISAAWAVDDDISRFLKCLPNWMNLVAESKREFGDLPANTPFSPPTAPSPIIESAEKIKERNCRESQVLLGNLGRETKIIDSEVIQDVTHLKAMANMQESLEWFCFSARRSLRSLPTPVLSQLTRKHSEADRLSNHTVTLPVGKQLELTIEKLEAMADTWILMLHLEIRMNCFYHILPIFSKESSHVLNGFHSQEVSPNVITLNRSLVQLDEIFRNSLNSRKVRYIFEGLGHLIAAIFINSSQHIAKINDNGKKRMCKNIFSIQQCLSNITLTRETDLDRARKYFELLYQKPDEILNRIMEKGAQFGQTEYENLLALAARSETGPLILEPGAAEMRKARLKEILAERKG